MIRLLALLALLACSSCINLGEAPPVSRYHLLEAAAKPSQNGSFQNLQLGFRTPHFPGYLDRPQLVSRSPENLILVAEKDRWAEPLADNLLRTLQENLRRQLPGIQLDSIPTSQSKLQLELFINRFDAFLGQRLDVDIRWVLYATKGDRELASGHYLDQRPLSGGYQQMSKALSAALVGLSDQLATTLREQAD